MIKQSILFRHLVRGRPTREANAGPSMESWHVGVVNKAQCEAAVVAGNNGDFLLRSLKNGKMILCVNDNGSAVNFTIKRNDVRCGSAADCTLGRMLSTRCLLLRHHHQMRQAPICFVHGRTLAYVRI